jgi:hypothetical protein
MNQSRSAEEIAKRVLILQCVIAAAHGVSRYDVLGWLAKEKLMSFASEAESAFLHDLNPTQSKQYRMQWMAEAQFTLMWAIGMISNLPEPTAKCDTGAIHKIIPGLFESTTPFIASAVKRRDVEIEAAESQIYDIHVDVRQAIRHGSTPPHGYDKDVVFFRHYAFVWLTDFEINNWDAVTPDT